MTTSVLITPHEHDLLVTTYSTGEDRGCQFHSSADQYIYKDQPRQLLHISRGVVLTVRELTEDDPVYLAHHAPPVEEPKTSSLPLSPPPEGAARGMDETS